MKYRVLLSLILFISCEKHIETTSEKFDTEFNNAVTQLGGKQYNHQNAPDWKATAYLKDDKIRLIRITTMPESGFIETLAYINPQNEIEKIVEHRHLPDWDSPKNANNPPSVYTDTTLEIFPKTGEVIKYDAAKCIETISQNTNIKTNIASVNYCLNQVRLALKN